MTYYCIPDIHGRYDLLEKALEYIYGKQESGKLFFLGDYIDRGPKNVDVLLTVMNPPENWEFVTLKGNHEDMFVGAYNRRYAEYYDYKALREIQDDPRLELTKAVEWMEHLPIVHLEGKNIFAHAFYDPRVRSEDQIPDYVLWERYSDVEPFHNDYGWHLTHGHTPRKNGPVRAINRTNLDTGAVFYDRLVIAEYEEEIAGPVNFVEFLG